MLDTEIKLINDERSNLELWDRVRVYIGTEEVMARVVPLGTDLLKAGESSFAQLRLEEEIAVKNYDKFIIRTYSPMITIGGGVILDANPKKHSRFNEEILEKLKVQLEGNTTDLIANYLLSHTDYLNSKENILKELQLPKEEVEESLTQLVESTTIYETKLGYIHKKKYDEVLEKLKKLLSDYHNRYKLKVGIPKIEVLSKFKISQKEMLELLDLFILNNEIRLEGNLVAEKDFEVNYDKKQLAEKERIEKALLDGGFTPPSVKELTNGEKSKVELLESLIDNTVVRLDADLVLHEKVFKDAVKKVEDHFKTNDQIVLAEFRDMTGSSRKYSMAILEYMDKIGITRRLENHRVLVKK